MVENEEKLTPSLILKMFAESAAKSEKEWQEIKEKFAETGKLIKELSEDRKETDKQIKELSKNIGGISNSNGEMAEEAIFNALEQNMTFAGIDFEYIERNTKRKKKSLNLETEIDVLLVNGSMLALIETKYRVKQNDVLKLTTDKLANFKKLFPEYNNRKIILGVGGMSFEDEAIISAKEKGIGIIKILGDKVEYYTEEIKIY